MPYREPGVERMQGPSEMDALPPWWTLEEGERRYGWQWGDPTMALSDGVVQIGGRRYFRCERGKHWVRDGQNHWRIPKPFERDSHCCMEHLPPALDKLPLL